MCRQTRIRRRNIISGQVALSRVFRHIPVRTKNESDGTSIRSLVVNDTAEAVLSRQPARLVIGGLLAPTGCGPAAFRAA